MENRTFWIIVGLLVVGAAVVFLQPTVEDRLAPTLDAAWVAIQPADSPMAVVGPVEIEQGKAFTLHAVVQGTTRGDEVIYYTEAERLEIDGQEVAPDRLRKWRRNRPVKIRWYTLEGRWPFLQLGEEGIGAFQFESFLRSDWPLTWSIPGDVDPANDNHLHSGDDLRPRDLGTQRYRVQLELYRMDDDLLPEKVVRSWGVEDLKREVERFPTVSMVAQGGAKGVSEFLGLTQLEPAVEDPSEMIRQIGELTDHRIAFSRATLLHELAEAAGTRFGDLSWSTADLTGELAWNPDAGGAGAGDLLRVGDRVVVLFEDRGTTGTVDYEDLCFDFVQGIEVRPLGDVFSGDGQAVEIARLGSPA